MGQVTVYSTTPAASPHYSLRVSAAFRLPQGLAPGVYDATICDEPCTTTIGWLFSSPVHVGIDPADPIGPVWPTRRPRDPLSRRRGTRGAFGVRGGDLQRHRRLERHGRRDPSGLSARAHHCPTGAGAGGGHYHHRRTAHQRAGRQCRQVAGRAGTDPGGGVPSEIVAWVTGFGVLLVVWCLAWRWRPGEARMVVRRATGSTTRGRRTTTRRRSTSSCERRRIHAMDRRQAAHQHGPAR